MRQISGNAGFEGAIVIGEGPQRARMPNYGFNAATGAYRRPGGRRRHRPDQGDPHGLQNAASIALLMLTTEAMICEIPEKKSAPAGRRRPRRPRPDMDY